MKYSVIIPAYCCERTIADTVDSILNAGLRDFEILLIDDGSPDGTPAVCDTLAREHECVRCIHQKNAGVSAARNRGIREAVGEYILFVDSDDLLQPFDGETLGILETGDVGMLMFGMVFQYYHKDRFVREERLVVEQKRIYDLRSLHEGFLNIFHSNYCSSSCNKFIRRSCLTENEVYFDGRLTNYEDLAFSLQAMSRCGKIALVPEAYYLYRVDYDHDHTVDRIAKIDDIMGNTDLIAERFMVLEGAMAPDGSEVQSLRRCLLSIYFELFGVKMRTTPLKRIKGYCRDFMEDRYVQMCLPRLPDMPERNRRMYAWIATENARAIWLHDRYIQIRHFVAKNIKRILRKG